VTKHLNREITGLATDYPAGELIASHKHDTHQVVHAMQGVIRVRSQSASWVVPPGRAIWMPAGHEHGIRCYTAVKMRTVYLDPGIDVSTEQCVVWSVSPLMREVIVRFAESPRPGTEKHLAAILFSEIEAIDTLPLQLPRPTDSRLKAITDTIHANPADDRSLADWAKQLGFSPRSLIRRFQQETNMTFRQWRRQARMLMALEKLANHESVTSIAVELGYDTSSAFCAAFRETFGVTPRQYFK
jgi:AraC-like DNA-binding protein